MKNLLLMSSSRLGQCGYLEYAESLLQDFLGEIKGELLFIPFAGVSISYNDYENQVGRVFERLGYSLKSVHHCDNYRQAISSAAGIIVGGGNSFYLLYQLYKHDLLECIREEVKKGKPYAGWSAGANMVAPTICTTNDMPIIQPPSFEALGLVPFQINPHFYDGVPKGFNGETRSQRLAEFMVLNPDAHVVALPEGSALEIRGQEIKLHGDEGAFIIENDCKISPVTSRELNFLFA